MKNKVELKKTIIISVVIIILFTILFGILNFYEYKIYTSTFNKKINQIISKVIEKNSKIEKVELIEIINSKDSSDNKILKEYGIDLNNDSVVLENDEYFTKFIIVNLTFLLLLAVILLAVFGNYNHNKNKKLKEITQYIEEINRKNYKLDIDDNTEDELSILKNEIYKTTVMLKEQAENSLTDKINLKDSLSDISHQLKTPLTSIIILLDNILDNPNMSEETRHEFIKDIKREITNINFLVQTLLKLSKFDANTITFVNNEVKIIDVIEETIKNVSTLCDLKDIKIKVNGDEKDTIVCDFKWQVEALTNILKNSVEYSNNSSGIIIEFEKNKVYSQVKIIDNGNGINKDDINHIFERFYKGKNSSKDSVGIGLALSKTIIEKNNGTISVESEMYKGTTFIIKYFN